MQKIDSRDQNRLEGFQQSLHEQMSKDVYDITTLGLIEFIENQCVNRLSTLGRYELELDLKLSRFWSHVFFQERKKLKGQKDLTHELIIGWSELQALAWEQKIIILKTLFPVNKYYCVRTEPPE